MNQSNFNKFTEKAPVRNIKTNKNGNPLFRKSGKQIQMQIDSRVMSIKCHAYCQPSHCAYYGGSYKNCDGTLREGKELLETHTMWVSSKGHNAFRPASMLVEGCDYATMVGTTEESSNGTSTSNLKGPGRRKDKPSF